ncbi:hypothetical protein L1286_22590 [Pseudoalteromonas sp. SMS1]|uniref:TlpA family protein disulfide reductase n=1 Tax=Pseudoalteromonas sp. SMS1 TaxID=2908894 RepID=UPI001F36160B|nr:hypothetical protein [Pseudoalteromonas sp. SMS1]MCF2860274.1 hypothetical protein [Pseudoalteromonas sp. SMS1]
MYIQPLKIFVIMLFIIAYKIHAQVQEYVFINIWDEYSQATSFPKAQGERTYIQPDINIDQASLAQFKSAYPAFENLIIDINNQLMFQYQIRQTPSRVIIKDGHVLLKETLLHAPHITTHTAIDKKMTTLSGKPLSKQQIQKDYRVLFFSDSLCPFQHIPDCQHRIAQNNELARHKPESILTIIKPFYVDEQSAQDYKKRFNINHHIVFDAQNQLFTQFEITDLPYWVVQDGNGKVIYRGAQVPQKYYLSL